MLIKQEDKEALIKEINREHSNNELFVVPQDVKAYFIKAIDHDQIIVIRPLGDPDLYYALGSRFEPLRKEPK